MRSVKHFINLQKEPDRLPIGASWYSNKKCGREGCQDIEELFCISSKWDQHTITNAPTGQTPGYGTYHIKHDQAFKAQPIYFSIGDDGGKL